MNNIIKIFDNPRIQSVDCSIICPMCKNVNSVKVCREGALKYAQGKNIQVAFPDLSASERELLLTGICDNCWKELFNDEENNH